MRRCAIHVSVVLLAALGFAPYLALAQQTQPEPAKAQVEVTYYYLPG